MNIRLPRTALLARLTDPDAPGITLIEAPIGFGKSWLLRRAAPEGAIRLRGELGPLRDDDLDSTPIVIDDAHSLDATATRVLVDRIEDAPSSARLTVAGRILGDPLHEAAHLLDGQILDTTALSITPDELIAAVDELPRPVADQVIQTADGSIRLIATALDQWRRHVDADPVSILSHLSRSASAAALQRLDQADAVLVGLLARAPGIDQSLLASLGGAGLLRRALEAGIPLRRQIAGDIDVLDGAFFRSHDIEASTATRLASALVQRDRPIEAVGLLLDARVHDQATELLRNLPESVTKMVDPRALLAALARIGAATERDPTLLLLRASASALIGRSDLQIADIAKAMKLAPQAEPRVRRRVSVASASRALLEGRIDEAVSLARHGLGDLGPGEERTFARAHEVLANAASVSGRRDDLQRAAEEYRVAAAAWDGCAEFGRARQCRYDMAMTVLVPLGRFNEALALLTQVSSVGGLSDGERSWAMACEGFVLYEANRLDSASAKFTRVADLGYLHDNVRIVAAAAWGQALIAARHEDVAVMRRWIATAENTALGDDDDLLGVLFECDVSTYFGALGELGAAERHLIRAEGRPSLYPDDVRRCRFILNARLGSLGDVDEQLTVTRPSERWRVLLVSALAVARSKQLGRARALLEAAEGELVGLGFGDFASLGERRAFDELQSLLQRHDATEMTSGVLTIGTLAASSSVPSQTAASIRVRVVGGPMVIEQGGNRIEIPPGNPQRLVGVVVANGGAATFDQLAEAMWPGDEPESGRARLRNVLLRLRRGAGNVITRSGSGVRLTAGVGCDLYEFDRLATDALSSARTDPDVAGQLAERAVALVDGPIFADYEYEEWALNARRSAENQLIGLLDLLSVQAEDAGDLPRAQSLAERALRYDRYTDSRYLRLAELLTMQGRSAAAVAVLEDATEVARELGAPLPDAAKERRDDLIRRAASS